MIPGAALVELTAIPHDADRHHAFTSLARWRGAWWCAFRSGVSHVSHDGTIAVWTRAAGEAWREAFVLTSPDPARPDLRDPSVIVVDGRLTVVATATRRRPDQSCRTWRWSAPVDDPTDAVPLGPVGWWLWSAVVAGDALVLGAYTTPGLGADDHRAALWRAPAVGGEATLVTELDRGAHRPNEAALTVDASGEWWCLLRCEDGPAKLGRADRIDGPWRLIELDRFVGGPALLVADDHVIAAGRAHRPGPAVVLWRVTGEGGLVDWVRLPSGGDCGYPALVAVPDGLVISYYTSDGGPTRVRVATLRTA